MIRNVELLLGLLVAAATLSGMCMVVCRFFERR